MKTPGSPYSVAPRTRNSIASSVLPQPAPPQTSVGRPAGNPPPVISSSPRMPVGAFRRRFGEDEDGFVVFMGGLSANRSFFMVKTHRLAKREEAVRPPGVARRNFLEAIYSMSRAGSGRECGFRT